MKIVKISTIQEFNLLKNLIDFNKFNFIENSYLVIVDNILAKQLKNVYYKNQEATISVAQYFNCDKIEFENDSIVSVTYQNITYKINDYFNANGIHTSKINGFAVHNETMYALYFNGNIKIKKIKLVDIRQTQLDGYLIDISRDLDECVLQLDKIVHCNNIYSAIDYLNMKYKNQIIWDSKHDQSGKINSFKNYKYQPSKIFVLYSTDRCRAETEIQNIKLR